MNYAKKTLWYFIGHTLVGIIALLYVLFSNLTGGYREGLIAGIVGGFILTGFLGTLISLRLLKNPQKAREVEIAKSEERTQLIRMKSNTGVYAVMLYAESIAALVTGLLGLKEICLILAAILILKIVLSLGFLSYYSKQY